jgi:hypothetical protein
MGWARHVRRKISARKPERKISFWNHTLRLVDNTGMDLEETGCANVEWINLAQNRVL